MRSKYHGEKWKIRTAGVGIHFRNFKAKNRLWRRREKEKDNGGVGQGSVSEGGEKWSLWGFIFKSEPTGSLMDLI